MERRQLEAFIAITDCGSFGRAAERLFVTQSAVSQSLRKLEDGLGESLLVRDRRGVRLTPAGSLFLPIARDILRRMDEGRQAIEDLHGLRTGKLTIGAVDVASLYLLPKVFRRFRERYPGIRLAVRVAGSRPLLAALARRELDLAFTLGERAPDGFEARRFGEDPMVPVGPAAGSPSASGQTGWITYPRGTVTRELLEKAFAKAGLPFPVLMEIDRPEVILQLVSAGLGQAVLPRRLVEFWGPAQQLRRLRLKGLKASRPIWLAHRKPEQLSPAARSFLAELGEG